MSELLSLLRHAFSLIIPDECRICGTHLADDEKYICTACEGVLPPYPSRLTRGNDFERRFEGKFPFEKGVALYHYTPSSTISDVVHDFKYRDCPGLAKHIGRLMARELRHSDFFDGVDALVPIGMHFWKKWRRGYNQAAMLAQGVSDETGIPVCHCLSMKRYHSTQTRRSLTERATSMQDIFRVNVAALGRCRRIILIDDICTTGATMTSAADALNENTGGKLALRLLCLGAT